MGSTPAEVYTGESVVIPTVNQLPPAMAPRSVTAQAPIGDEVIVPDFAGLSLREAYDMAAVAQLQLETDSAGYVLKQWPLAGTRVAADSSVELELERRYRQSSLGMNQ